MGLFAEIAEDFSNVYKNDPAISSRIELFFNYPGVWAIFWYRIANRLYRRGFKSFARFLMGVNQILTNIDIHPGATIGRRVFIDHGFGVVIGQTAIVVSLTPGKRHPTIKSGVVIGAGAKVLGNITIGANSKIGANSVVVREVPENSTAIGIPAHVIQKGRDKDPFSHNKLPDINKEMFEYLLKRVAVLEHYMVQDNKEILEQDLQLENIYESFIKAMKH
ncbi:MAG: serine O-acetyltransferase EpsC [Campylobacterota bacterium]